MHMLNVSRSAPKKILQALRLRLLNPRTDSVAWTQQCQPRQAGKPQRAMLQQTRHGTCGGQSSVPRLSVQPGRLVPAHTQPILKRMDEEVSCILET